MLVFLTKIFDIIQNGQKLFWGYMILQSSIMVLWNNLKNLRLLGFKPSFKICSEDLIEMIYKFRKM